MRAYLHRSNIILAAISALILFYFNILALLAYLLTLLVVVVVFHLACANGAAKIQSFVANTTTLIITFLCLAVLLEIGLHLNPHFFLGNQDPDTLGEFSDFTSRGYLTEQVFKKPKGVFRIMGLGDSFAVYPPNNNPKHNYNFILEEKFAAAYPGKVGIVNAGMPGVGPGYYWRILEKYGDRIKPDLVMVGFFVGNDFTESELFIVIGNFISEPKDLKKKMVRYFEVRNSRLGKLVNRKYTAYCEERRRTREVEDKGVRDNGVFSEETFLHMEKNRSWIFDKKNRPALERDWQQCARLIAQMKQWCDHRKIDLVLMVFPDQVQVDEDLRSRLTKKYHLTAESLDLNYPNSLIAGFCRENHLHCLDLLAPFQEKNKLRPLYALRDSHWNEAGNRLAAELIYKYLEEHKLIKAD